MVSRSMMLRARTTREEPLYRSMERNFESRVILPEIKEA